MIPNQDSERIEIGVSRGTPDELPFYCVSAAKLSILSFVTFGLYELFWFYKNWTLVKARSGLNIRPFWRAFFSPFFCYSFVNTVNSAAQSLNVTPKIKPGLIAGFYFGLIVLHRLPDPYWLISLFSFLPLILIARLIRRIHETARPGFDSVVGWGGGAYATLVVGSFFTVLGFIGTFGPPTRALRQSEIPPSYHTTLVEAGVLEPRERMQFFYSAGTFSILEDGNLFTENRVISYLTLDGELQVASSPYSEILDLDVVFSESFLDPTSITVSTFDGRQFILVVSNEEELDKEFVSELQRRFSASRLP